MNTAVSQIETSNPCVIAFQITGELDSDDMNQIGEVMNRTFDLYEKASLMLVFDKFEGAEPASVFDPEALKAQLRSLAKIEKYAVVGAPDALQSFLDTMGGIIPVESRTFDRDEIQAAWAFVDARPAETDAKS